MNVYRMCTGKTRYASRSNAKKSLAKRGLEQRIYACPLCDGFHSSTKPSLSETNEGRLEHVAELMAPLLADRLSLSEICKQLDLTPKRAQAALERIRKATP